MLALVSTEFDSLNVPSKIGRTSSSKGKKSVQRALFLKLRKNVSVKYQSLSHGGAVR